MTDPFSAGIVGFPGDRPQYVNGVQINVSPWDFVFGFQHQSVIGEVEGEPQVLAVPVTRIVMSPQHAKALHLALAETMGTYEEQFGVLPDMRAIAPPGGEG